MRRYPLERLSIRAALVLGFGLVIGLWLFMGYTFTRRMSDMEAQTSKVTERYLRAQDVLSTVRSQTNVSSIILRDALIDPSPAARPAYLRRLENGYRVLDEALSGYVPVFETSSERADVGRLRTEVDAFHKVILDVLNAYPGDGRTSASDLLARWIVPRRAAAIGVSDEIRALNRSALVQHQLATAQIHRAAERQWWYGLGLALAATLSIAFVAVLYAGRLEDWLRHERDKDAQHKLDLQRLSARLVAAQEEERLRIARELHDEVGQVLTAVKVDLQVAQRAMRGHAEAVRVLDELQGLTDGALQTVRTLSQLLRPTMLDDLGLGAAIDWLLRGLARRHQIEVELDQAAVPERLDAETEVAAFRIAQEALTNVAKHSRASKCTVRLSLLESRLMLTVEDNGIGFAPTIVELPGLRRGLGLIGIRERAAACGGRLTIDSAPGSGTRLLIELPVDRAAIPAPAIEDTAALSASLQKPSVLHG
jgi:signal transduction histidine kinase